MKKTTFAVLWVKKNVPQNKHAKSTRRSRVLHARDMQIFCDEINRALEQCPGRAISERSKDGIVAVALGDKCDQFFVERKLLELKYRIIGCGKITTDLPLTIELLASSDLS